MTKEKKRTFSKSTPEEIKKIIELYKRGLTLSEIGRRMGRDHTSIRYWVKKAEKKEGIVIKRKKKKKKKEPPKKNRCQFCGRPKKNPKWDKTQYCSKKCWELANEKDATRKAWWIDSINARFPH